MTLLVYRTDSDRTCMQVVYQGIKCISTHNFPNMIHGLAALFPPKAIHCVWGYNGHLLHDNDVFSFPLDFCYPGKKVITTSDNMFLCRYSY